MPLSKVAPPSSSTDVTQVLEAFASSKKFSKKRPVVPPKEAPLTKIAKIIYVEEGEEHISPKKASESLIVEASKDIKEQNPSTPAPLLPISVFSSPSALEKM